jgi:hypothetical protein
LVKEQIGKLMAESDVELTAAELDEVMKDVDKDGGGDVRLPSHDRAHSFTANLDGTAVGGFQ